MPGTRHALGPAKPDPSAGHDAEQMADSPKPLTDKIALVTGASRGIGAAVAGKLAQRGADVVINFRSKGPRAEEVAAQVQGYGRRALLAQADLTQIANLDDMAKLVGQTFGRLDLLVLNASGGE